MNFPKNFSLSFSTVIIVLLCLASLLFGTIQASASSAETERFSFLTGGISTLFNEIDANRTTSNSPLKRTENIENSDSQVFEQFDTWVKSYVNNGYKADDEQMNVGADLAVKRKQLLKELIKLNPQAALERAIPADAFEKLPSFISENSERRVSVYGDFLVYFVDEMDYAVDKNSGVRDGKLAHGRTERAVAFDGLKYKAFVYGRREAMTTKMNIPLQGIILDDVMAVDENPVKRISSDEYQKHSVEQSKLSEDEAVAEVGGKVVYFSNQAELSSFVDDQIAWESKIGPVRPKTNSANGSLAPEGVANAWTQGAKTVFVIRVDFSDRPGDPVDPSNQPLTVTRLQNLFTGQVNPFYVASSYNTTSMQATITPTVVRMPQTLAYYSTNYYQIWDDARAAARAQNPQYETNNYDLDIIAFSYTSAIGWAGLGYVGGKGTLINGSFDIRVASHELGHNYGLNHANLWRTTDGSVNGQGSNVEYGDNFDMMGYGGNSQYHFNASYKRSLEWLTDANVQTVTSSGTYQIYAQDASSPGGIRGLKIKKDATENYWVEFRQLFTGNSNVMNGALVRRQYTGGGLPQTLLLDMNPGTSSLVDSPLLVGQAGYYDSVNQIRITVLSKGNTVPESLNVKVELNSTGSATPTPTATPTPNPACTYSITPTNQSFDTAGGTGSVNVTTQSGCSWTAASNQSFVGITSGSAGSGSGTVNYSVLANNSAARTATLMVAGQSFIIQQTGTTVNNYTLVASPGVITAGGVVTVNFTAPSGSSTLDWVGLFTPGTANTQYLGYIGTNGYTSGSFTISLNQPGQYEFRYLLENGYTSVITSNVVTVQAAPTPMPTPIPCTYSIGSPGQSFGSAGGSGSVGITAPSGCGWTPVTSSSFITVVTGSGSGSNTISYSVAANLGSARTGTITVGGQNFTVTQAAAPPSYEADISPRGTGDGVVSSTDVALIQSFQLGLAYDSSEFQRADCAPFETRGDGRISSLDVAQAQAYQLGFNRTIDGILQLAAGPTAASAVGAVVPEFDKLSHSGEENQVRDVVQSSREARVAATGGSAGQIVTVPIEVNAVGDESVYGFSLNYDSTKLSNPVVSAGTAGGLVLSNTSQAGSIGIVVSYGGGTIAAGSNQRLVNVQFQIAADAADGATPLIFTDAVTFREVASSSSNQNGITALPIIFTDSVLTVGAPTTAVSVSGRVTTGQGKGIKNVSVTLTDGRGNVQTATTTSFGYYRFGGVAVGEIYTVEVKAKHYQFTPATQTLNLTKETGDINFIAFSSRTF